MKLKKIKLSGFKSFIDITEIEINEDLVAIVGPNGCGKSNLVDAIKWVLGESSARQLRGDSLVDVIFNGSLKRKAVSRAMVELIFNNDTDKYASSHNQWLQCTEIAIKRVLTRDSVSTYFINNAVVRKKDIVDLFLGTGVSSRGYAIIEQGMINRILESKPDDLRLYLDEASGISRYQERRKETLQRLNNTRDNISRVEDNNAELITQVAKLQEQATSVKLYNELKEQEVELKVYVNLKQQNQLQQEIQEIQDALVKSELEYNSNLQQKDKLEAKINDTLEMHNNYKTELDSTNYAFNQLRLEQAKIEEREAGRISLQDRINQEVAHNTVQVSSINDQLSEARLQIADIDRIVIDNEVYRESLEDNMIEYADKETKSLQIQSEYSTKNLDLNTKILNKKHQLENVITAINYNKNKQSDCYGKLEILKSSQTKIQSNDSIIDVGNIHRDILSKIAKIQTQLADDKAKHKNYQQSIQQHQETRANLKLELQDLQLRIEYNTKEIDKYDVTRLGLLPLLSSVLDGIQIKSGSETLIKSLLSNYLSLPVFDHVPDELIDQSLTILLTHEHVITSETKHNFDILDHIVIKDSRLNFLQKYFAEYKCIDNLSLLDLTDELVITRDGHLYINGILHYSAHTKIEAFFNLFQECSKYSEALQAKNILFATLEQELIVLQDSYARCETMINVASTELSHLYSEEKSSELKLQQMQSLLDEQSRVAMRDQADAATIKLDLSNLEQEEHKLIETNETLLIELEDLELSLDDFLDELSKIEANANVVKQQKQEQEKLLNQNNIDLAKMYQTRESLFLVLQDKEKLLSSYKLKLEELQTVTDLDYTNENSDRLVVIQDELNALSQSIREYQTKISELNQQIAQDKDINSSLYDVSSSLGEKMVKFRFRDQECKIRLNILKESFTEHNDFIDKHEYILAKYDYEILEVNKIIEKISGDINEIGLVNHKAIDELNEVESRVSNLTRNLNELQVAMVDLEDAIKQIDNESSAIIKNTFAKINDGLSHFFKVLFGGGNASLKFVDPEDMLNSGITIMAEPLGKKNSSINLLSGGEKALSAMSFIFALFNLNPSPFCLLDEVDAPLDDANTERFCNLVKQMSNNTQFVYISHNRLTMEMAQQLIGVTMQEKGVSTVINVDLVEYSA